MSGAIGVSTEEQAVISGQVLRRKFLDGFFIPYGSDRQILPAVLVNLIDGYLDPEVKLNDLLNLSSLRNLIRYPIDQIKYVTEVERHVVWLGYDSGYQHFIYKMTVCYNNGAQQEWVRLEKEHFFLVMFKYLKPDDRKECKEYLDEYCKENGLNRQDLLSCLGIPEEPQSDSFAELSPAIDSMQNQNNKANDEIIGQVRQRFLNEALKDSFNQADGTQTRLGFFVDIINGYLSSPLELEKLTYPTEEIQGIKYTGGGQSIIVVLI